jgi:hypothetical protein
MSKMEINNNEENKMDEGNVDDNEQTTIQFRKRGKVSGIRKKPASFTDEGENESKVEDKDGSESQEVQQEAGSSDDHGINKEKLRALQYLNKTSKQRMLGVSVDFSNKSSSATGKSSKPKSSFNSQFLVKNEHGLGLQQAVPHENIMHQYINDKLGVKKE